jgi:hypothetical protein
MIRTMMIGSIDTPRTLLHSVIPKDLMGVEDLAGRV